MFRTEIVQKIKAHILGSVTPPFFNRAFCEITWKNVVERGRPQMTIWRMRIACCTRIPKATSTHSEYEILISFPLQQWLYERASLLRYSYITCLVVL
jgi:hypothetical protein